MTTPPNNPRKAKYRDTPIGTGLHPWLNKPDTKFDESGEYKVDLVLSGEPAIKFRDLVKAEAELSHQEGTAEMTPGERKKWSIYYPYEELEDAEGNPTGEIKFKLRQNAVIRLKDGTTREVKMMLADAGGEETTKPIFSGCTLRARYSMRHIKMTSAKQFGVRLDMAGAQVLKFGGGAAGGGMKFGAVEGYDMDDSPAGSSGAASDDSDY